jgi:NAD(P)-dependent dehydrogenase (short-subunit alcohol dehydrogenase family)
MTQNRTALITGAASGFGLLTSVELARRGWRVVATMRDTWRQHKLEDAAIAARVRDNIEILPMDVTRASEIAAVVEELEARETRIDALVNNAGFAMAGFADDVSEAELRRQLDTNFFGAAAVTRAFLPQMRRQGFGRIVMLSSISGRVGFPGIPSYCASKYALEGWSESLRHELRPLGIQVSLVEPGSFETDIWTRNAVISERSQDARSPNAARLERWRERVRKGGKKSDPRRVAEGIAEILEAPNPKMRYVFGRDAKLALAAKSLLPWGLWERLVARSAGLDV